MRRTYFANVRLDAVSQAEAAVLGTVVASVRIQPADGGAHGQSQMKKMREKPRVVDIGGGGNGAQRDTLGRDHDMILGPRPCRGRWGWARSARRRAWPAPNNCRPPRPMTGFQGLPAPCGSEWHEPDAGGLWYSSRPGDGVRSSRKHAWRWPAAHATVRPHGRRTAASRRP
jgi:hypothetical protein